MSNTAAERHYDLLRLELLMIKDDAAREAYVNFHCAQRDRYLTEPASIRAHHNWPGGYSTHIWEVVRNLRLHLSVVQLPVPVSFTGDDAIIAAYIHDLDKLLYRYELDPEKPSPAQQKYARDLGIADDPLETKSTISAKIDAIKTGVALDHARIPRHRYREDALSFEDGAIVMKLCCDHGLPVSLPALHAVCVHHGGFSALAADKRGRMQMSDLGVLLHSADLLSASAQKGNPLSPIV